jgi:hypothetical protein
VVPKGVLEDVPVTPVRSLRRGRDDGDDVFRQAQVGGAGRAGQGAEMRYSLPGRHGDGDDQPSFGVQKSSAGDQQPARVDLGAGPGQQYEVGGAGRVAERGDAGVAVQSDVVSSGVGRGRGERRVLVDVDDDVAGLGVSVDEPAGDLRCQTTGLR